MPGYYSDFVVPTYLASATDYTTWVGAAGPANINAILRSCTRMVQDATQSAFYDIDTLTGLATSTQTKNALRDATCAQAAAWVALNIDPLTGGVLTTSGSKRMKKIGSASVEYDQGEIATVTAARADAYTCLVPDAMRILSQNNLLGFGPYGIG